MSDPTKALLRDALVWVDECYDSKGTATERDSAAWALRQAIGEPPTDPPDCALPNCPIHDPPGADHMEVYLESRRDEVFPVAQPDALDLEAITRIASELMPGNEAKVLALVAEVERLRAMYEARVGDHEALIVDYDRLREAVDELLLSVRPAVWGIFVGADALAALRRARGDE